MTKLGWRFAAPTKRESDLIAIRAALYEPDSLDAIEWCYTLGDRRLHEYKRKELVVLEQQYAPALKAPPLPAAVPVPRVCYVYVIRRRDTQEIKIGVSYDPAARLRTLQTAHGEPLELVTAFPGAEAMEETLHRRFAAHRKLGEWFAEVPEIAAWIREVQNDGQ